MYFDSHLHSEGLGFSNLKEMAEKGIRKICTLAFYPVQPRYAETMLDLFRKLIEFEPMRGEAAGVDVYPAIGVHPRCIPPKYDVVIEQMESFDAKAFGEIGLETASELEREVLKKQLELAKRIDMPCIIHTPRKNKREVTEKTLAVLESVEFPESLAVIDHVNFDTIEMVYEKGYMIGLTVQPGKLSPEDVVRIIEGKDAERFMLNSDAGFSDSDYTAVCKAAKALEEAGRDVELIAFRNAMRFLRI